MKHQETKDTILNILIRSEESQTTPYSYEIYATSHNSMQVLVPRTSGSAKFAIDFDKAVEAAMAQGKQMKITVFKGKSAKSAEISSYSVNVSGQVQQLYSDEDVQQLVAEKLAKFQESQPQPLSGLDGLGFMEKLNIAERNHDRMQFEHRQREFENSFKMNAIQEKLEALKTRNTELETLLSTTKEENTVLKASNAQNEELIASSATNQLLARVATGVASNIGAKLITGSPKIAGLLGVTQEELGMALGTIDSPIEEPPSSPISNANVEFEAVVEESDSHKKVTDLSAMLKSLPDSEITKFITINAVCYDDLQLRDEFFMKTKEKIAPKN